ncbi:hypothetical protein BJX64DRAFT_42566 [Aspergillus heterothallicus]
MLHCDKDMALAWSLVWSDTVQCTPKKVSSPWFLLIIHLEELKVLDEARQNPSGQDVFGHRIRLDRKAHSSAPRILLEDSLLPPLRARGLEDCHSFSSRLARRYRASDHLMGHTGG